MLYYRPPVLPVCFFSYLLIAGYGTFPSFVDDQLEIANVAVFELCNFVGAACLCAQLLLLRTPYAAN
jgi:hypothetical protein